MPVDADGREPAVPGGVVRDALDRLVQQRVMAQVRRLVQRPLRIAQQGRAADGEEEFLHQQVRAQARIVAPPEADRHVHVLAGEIRQPRVDRDPHLQIRMLRLQRAEPRE